MSKKPAAQTTTQRTEVDPTVRPFLESGLQEAQRIYQQGPRDIFPQSLIPEQSAATQAGLNLAQQQAYGSIPALQLGQSELLNTAAGLRRGEGSDVLQGAIDASLAPITRQFREATAPSLASQFARAGRTGSEAEQRAFGRAESELAGALSREASRLALPEFERARSEQLRAVAALPEYQQALLAPSQTLLGVGGAEEARQAQQLAEQAARFQQQQTGQEMVLDEYLARVGGLAPLFGSTTTGVTSGGGGSPFSSLLGIGALGLGVAGLPMFAGTTAASAGTGALAGLGASPARFNIAPLTTRL